jgi:uncharacterized protein (DUF58 family)
LIDAPTQLRLDRLTARPSTRPPAAVPGPQRLDRRGGGGEFRQRREYVAGDSPARIDWRVFARTDRYYVREFDQDASRPVLILLDTSGSMDYGDGPTHKGRFASSFAAAASYVLLGRGDAVGLSPWPAGHATPIDDGPAAMGAIAERLRSLAWDGAFTRPPAVARHAATVVISDFAAAADAWASLLAPQSGRGRTTWVKIEHADEARLPFDRRVRFIDAERGGSSDVDPALLRSEYRQRWRRHRQQIAALARRAGGSCVNADTSEDVVGLVARCLSALDAAGGGP